MSFYYLFSESTTLGANDYKIGNEILIAKNFVIKIFRYDCSLSSQLAKTRHRLL